MIEKSVDITILCKVVDNFGDIGVTWRLARHLCSYLDIGRQEDSYLSNGTPAEDLTSYQAARLRFVCDDLVSFSKINNKIDPNKSFQECGGVKIYNWNDYDFCYNEFAKSPPEIILECFQCGRPDWMEKILFDDQKCDAISEQANFGKADNLPTRSIWNNTNRIVNIIMIDYLSAEKYQEDFHCLKSLTRSAKVQKVNFMPGFTNKTGGLLLPFTHPNTETPTEQTSFSGAVTKDELISHLDVVTATEYSFSQGASCLKRILFFAYKNDWSPVVCAMNRAFSTDTEVLVAAGQGQQSILEACKSCNANFRTIPLDFMNQPDWDNLMWSCDLLFVRGEDSLAQSCLRGVPFIWQAYPQSEEYQIVKVKALLERMKPHFSEEFHYIENAWMEINENSTPPVPAPITQNAENHTVGLENKSTLKIEAAIYDFLSHADTLREGFSSFSKSLYENGDLASNLMTFIWKNIIIGK